MSGSCMMTSRLLPSRCSMTSQKTSLASEKPCESNWTRYVLLTLLRRVASRSSLRIAVLESQWTLLHQTRKRRIHTRTQWGRLTDD